MSNMCHSQHGPPTIFIQDYPVVRIVGNSCTSTVQIIYLLFCTGLIFMIAEYFQLHGASSFEFKLSELQVQVSNSRVCNIRTGLDFWASSFEFKLSELQVQISNSTVCNIRTGLDFWLHRSSLSSQSCKFRFLIQQYAI